MISERGGASLNYKYLRKRKWYRTFKIILLPFYLAVLPLNLWHAWRWHGEAKFDLRVFLIGVFISLLLIFLTKFITVSIVEGKKAYLAPWSR
jgi:hypothetical protein